MLKSAKTSAYKLLLQAESVCVRERDRNLGVGFILKRERKRESVCERDREKERERDGACENREREGIHAIRDTSPHPSRQVT